MMDAAARAALDAAYRATLYCVQLPLGELVLLLDRQHPDGDRRLREEADVRSHWAVVTACNPYSRTLQETENRERNEKLRQSLLSLGIPHVDSVNRDPQGLWPDEPGFFLCDPLPGQAEGLGLQFQQHAVVQGHLGQSAPLLWLLP